MKNILIIGAGAMGSAFSVPCVDNNNNSWRRSRRASFRPPPPPQLEVTPEQESQLLQLHEMGFTNRNAALGALRANDFNLNGRAKS